MAITQTSFGISFTYRNFNSLKGWLNSIIENHKLKTGEITIVFASDEYLLSLNREFLNHDYYTDVLTFNYSALPEISGDILISIERVKDNAKQYKKKYYQELDRVILHGILHLLGYEDSSAKTLQEMRKTEDTYLAIR